MTFGKFSRQPSTLPTPPDPTRHKQRDSRVPSRRGRNDPAVSQTDLPTPLTRPSAREGHGPLGPRSARSGSGLRYLMTLGKGARKRQRATLNRCRGLCLVPVVERARREDWPGFLEELRGQSPELARLVEAGCIRAMGWYPVAWYRDVYVALAASVRNIESIAREIGVESTRRDLERGAFRVLLKVVSPVFLVERAPSFFRAYVERGRLQVEQQGERRLLLRFSGCVGFSAAIYQDVVGGCEGALLAAGAEQVSVELLEGGRDGDEQALVLAYWRS